MVYVPNSLNLENNDELILGYPIWPYFQINPLTQQKNTTIVALHISGLRKAYRAASATLFTKQKPVLLVGPAWCPGGRHKAIPPAGPLVTLRSTS